MERLDAGAGAQAAPRRRWRLLFVITSSDMGGAETFLRELVTRLDRRQFEPFVCSLRPAGRIAQEIEASGTKVISLEMSEHPRIGELAVGIVRLALLMRTLRLDLVQGFLYRANVSIALAARLLPHRPLVVAGQHSLFPLTGARASLAARWTHTLSDRVVAVSNAVAEQLRRVDGIPPQLITVIQNGVDIERFTAEQGERPGFSLGLPGDTVVVGSVGRLSPEKGLDLLLEAVAMLRAEGVPLALILAGDGPQRRALERYALDLGLANATKFLGPLPDPRPALAALDVFVLPSLQEASPTALLEAMACGKAVVAAAVGGVPEIIEPEISGLLVPAGSSSALAEALRRVSADGNLRARLGAEARRRVASEFGIGRMVDRYGDLYRSLLAARSRASRQAVG